ncbi:MAG: DUF433 domain-containing protein [Candidatus Obscuribacterales bacterium]|nr:DUF433 domain-containing protein [Candidatus Obscuribacterales bacterium]
MTKEQSNLDDPDMQGATAALIRAARSARKLAAQTGTAIVVVRDGKLIHEYPKLSEFEEVKELNERDRVESAAESSKKQRNQKMNYKDIITIEPGKRSGKPCIRGMRITVADVLECLAAGMSYEDVLSDFPDLTIEDIRACIAFAADCERRLFGKTPK